MATSSQGKLVTIQEAKRFACECFLAVGCSQSHAEIMSDILVYADCRGALGHGLYRLESHIDDLKNGIINTRVTPKILKESPATAWVDGQNALGPVVGNFCINLAISKCKKTGIGWVSAKGSNHFVVGSYYTEQAQSHGYIGMAFTNNVPCVTPTRAKAAALGTNPLTLSAPAANNDSFCLDMATSVVSTGTILLQKGKRQRIPEGWALNAYGNTETDPEVAFKAERFLPLGGDERTASFKGTGLAMVAEIFCGILAGAHYGPHIRRWGDATRISDLGQSFVVLNPDCFAPGFADRLSDLMNSIRKLTPLTPGNLVLVPGDPERAHKKTVDKEGGIKYLNNFLDSLHKLAVQLKVKPMTSK